MVPGIYINGELIGGINELNDAEKNGKLEFVLDAAGVSHNLKHFNSLHI